MAQVPQTPAPKRLLPTVASPGDLRVLSADELCQLAVKIQEFLVEKVCATGGHLGPNLGMVELTAATALPLWEERHDLAPASCSYRCLPAGVTPGRGTRACPWAGTARQALPVLDNRLHRRINGILADFGVPCGNGKGQIFVRGEVIRTVPEANTGDADVEEALCLTDDTPTNGTEEAAS
ncbi:hypothetical protein KBY55_18400 [Streptomyces sp. b94]|uniref:1-deoxy-D-xylulose-5-phosphate synthase N-terminal domain-containing protein n=1 Tax=Streptomyces sp. b94 TaxID=1827634 RepID=UPI001B389CB2|nr:1-deoxy-D-xylulose-5-phosphate synthase N-terminal domain-containing protein [Streptomyces sp. b94]MBQ1098000.1 hypothetical protein [Streptomyces sp. b94]